MGYAIEGEILKLKTLFSQITTQPAIIEVTEPEVIKEDFNAYQYLINKLK
jgi:hypothetical protein